MRAPLRLDRRAVLLSGVAASIWAWRGGTIAAAPTPARRLTVAPASLALAPPPAAPTRLLAYEGTVPGPLIRLKRGEELALSLANRLDAPTTLSFPGLRLANALAGVAGLTQAAIEPGGEAEIRFTPPDAGFNLYLPDVGAATARQLAAGLFGPIVVEEPSPPEVDLEATVVLADWRLDEADRLRDDAGPAGALVTAGASAAPQWFAAPPGARVRLRLANASATRAMTIADRRRAEAGAPCVSRASRESAAAEGDRPRPRAALRADAFGRRRRGAGDQWRDAERLERQAAIRRPARRAGHARAGQRNGDNPDDAARRSRRAPAARPRRRLGALLARRLHRPAGTNRPPRLRRRQSRQMADRLGDSRQPRRGLERLVPGRVRRADRAPVRPPPRRNRRARSCPSCGRFRSTRARA